MVGALNAGFGNRSRPALIQRIFRRWCPSLKLGDLVEWTAIRDNRMAVQFTPTKGISACPSGTTLSTVSNKTWLKVEGSFGVTGIRTESLPLAVSVSGKRDFGAREICAETTCRR
jgi:hypothetical protein